MRHDITIVYSTKTKSSARVYECILLDILRVFAVTVLFYVKILLKEK